MHGHPRAIGLADINDPETGQPGKWTEPRNFSGLLKSFLGPVFACVSQAVALEVGVHRIPGTPPTAATSDYFMALGPAGIPGSRAPWSSRNGGYSSRMSEAYACTRNAHR